jgi:hypothetical protein
MQDVGEGLSTARLREKRDKVYRVSLRKGDTNLRILLEATDSRPVSGAWIDYEDGRFLLVAWRDGRCVFGDNAQEDVVDGMRKLPRIQNGLGPKIKERRQPASFMLYQIVGALPERIPEENGAFEEVTAVSPQVLR